MTETPERAIELLKTFVDDDPCRLDHHGNCQTHSLGNPCNVAEAREFLASLGEPALSEAEADAIFAASRSAFSGIPRTENALVGLIYEAKLNRELMNVDVDKPPFYPGEVIRGRVVLDIIRDRIRHLIRESARLSASAPSPEDKGSRC